MNDTFNYNENKERGGTDRNKDNENWEIKKSDRWKNEKKTIKYEGKGYKIAKNYAFGLYNLRRSSTGVLLFLRNRPRFQRTERFRPSRDRGRPPESRRRRAWSAERLPEAKKLNQFKRRCLWFLNWPFFFICHKFNKGNKCSTHNDSLRLKDWLKKIK